MSFLNLGSRSPCRYQNISTIVDPQVNKMHTAKNTFSGRGGAEGKTNELIIVTRTTNDVHPPTTRCIIRSRAEVSPNRGLLSRPPLVPYVLVVKSSMSTKKSVPSFSSALLRKHRVSAACSAAHHTTGAHCSNNVLYLCKDCLTPVRNQLWFSMGSKSNPFVPDCVKISIPWEPAMSLLKTHNLKKYNNHDGPGVI